MDQHAALLNRIMGVVAIWFMAMFVAWLSNKIRSLREVEAVIRRRLEEKELSLKQTLDASGMAMREQSGYSLQYRVHAPDNRRQLVTARGRFIYRDNLPVRMIGVYLNVTDRDPSTMEQSEQVVIDLEELSRNTAWREPSWKKPRKWVQRVTRLGTERIRILPTKPKNIS